MSLDIHYCRLCLQKTEGPAKTLSKDSDVLTLITRLFPNMDTSFVINSMLCIECFKYVQFSNLMIDTVTKNEQKILLHLQNTHSFEKITCRLCLSNEKLEGAVCLFKNTNEAARHVIEMAIIDLDFDIFRKPVMCMSCWQIVTCIYLFKNKCFVTEKMLKYYRAANKINSLDRTELEKVSLFYQEKLQLFSENLAEDTFSCDINDINKSNLTQNIANSQYLYLNSFAEHKGDVFDEAPYIPYTLNIESESLKEEDELEIKEEKLFEFNEINENINISAGTVHLGGIDSVQKTERASSASEILAIKTENVENSCLSLKSPSEPGIDVKEAIHGNNDQVLHDSLKKHMQTHQTKPKTFKCQKCDFVTRKHTYLKRHMLIHQENYNFSCDKCSFRTNTKSNLGRHMLVHQENYKFSCEKCTFRSKTKSNLGRHMLVHQENYNFSCDKCSHRSKTKSNLTAHMLVHQENRNFSCDKCGFQTKRKSYLVNHMLTHQEKYSFSCDKCSHRSKTKLHLVSHMLVHQENYNFSCDDCSYRSKTKSNLARHMLVHQENFNFSCEKCGFQTKRKCTLFRHMLVHQETYNFLCEQCSFQTKQKSQLVRHMLIHKKKYNFSCDKCSYRSKTKRNLVSHMLIHQENYNFLCDKCSYQTKRKSRLAKHVLIH